MKNLCHSEGRYQFEPEESLLRWKERKKATSKTAFTMAEVLITLGIIGVVAALTIPSLMAKYEKVVLKNQFKKSYSILMRNLQKAEYEMGYKPQCYYWDVNPYGGNICKTYGSDGSCIETTLIDGRPLPSDYNGNDSECGLFMPYFEKSLKIVKRCENKAYEKGCIPRYKGIDTVYKDSNPDASDQDANKASSGCSAWKETNILNSREAFVLQDGTIFISFFNKSPKLFAVDINGKKGPNKWGYDVFAFNIRSSFSKSLNLFESTCGPVERGGLSTSKMISEMNK